jgi:hypothetical protein
MSHHAGVSDASEMFRSRPWPFPDGRFPADLGAVVQRSVLDGTMPALLIVHTADNAWLIGDGVNDPNEPDAVIATHIWHAIEHNSFLATLAGLPPGKEARRATPSEPWVISDFEFAPE